MLRIHVYTAKMYIPAYKDEEIKLIKASHEPIVSEDLFNDGQDVINGRRRKGHQSIKGKKNFL